MKKCTCCGASKPLEDFHYRKDRDTYRTECKQCTKDKAKIYRKENKNKVRDIQYRYSYGITLEEYNSELADKIVRITDTKRYPNYYYDTEIFNGMVCKVRHYKDVGLRTQPMKKYGLCTIKNVRQIVLYHLFDESYENKFREILKRITAP